MRFLVSYWKLCISVSLILCWLKMGTLHAEETVLMSYGGHNESIGPYWVAIDKGFYQKHGLDARPLQVRNAQISLAALVSGKYRCSYLRLAMSSAVFRQGRRSAVSLFRSGEFRGS